MTCFREGVPSFGVHSTQVPEVHVQEGIFTAGCPPALGVHCLSSITDSGFSQSGELEMLEQTVTVPKSCFV